MRFLKKAHFMTGIIIHVFMIILLCIFIIIIWKKWREGKEKMLIDVGSVLLLLLLLLLLSFN